MAYVNETSFAVNVHYHSSIEQYKALTIQEGSTPSWRPRYLHSVEYFQGKVWLIAGAAIGDPDERVIEALSDVWYTTDMVTWTKACEGEFPARFGHISFVFNDKLWVSGGKTSYNKGDHTPTAPTDLTDMYSSVDGSTWVLETSSTDWGNIYGGLAVGGLDEDGLSIMRVMGGEGDATDHASDPTLWYSYDGSSWSSYTYYKVYRIGVGGQCVFHNNQNYFLQGRYKTGDTSWLERTLQRRTDGPLFGSSSGDYESVGSESWGVFGQMLLYNQNRLMHIGGVTDSPDDDDDVNTYLLDDQTVFDEVRTLDWNTEDDISFSISNSERVPYGHRSINYRGTVWIIGGATTTYYRPGLVDKVGSLRWVCGENDVTDATKDPETGRLWFVTENNLIENYPTIGIIRSTSKDRIGKVSKVKSRVNGDKWILIDYSYLNRVSHTSATDTPSTSYRSVPFGYGTTAYCYHKRGFYGYVRYQGLRHETDAPYDSGDGAESTAYLWSHLVDGSDVYFGNQYGKLISWSGSGNMSVVAQRYSTYSNVRHLFKYKGSIYGNAYPSKILEWNGVDAWTLAHNLGSGSTYALSHTTIDGDYVVGLFDDDIAVWDDSPLLRTGGSYNYRELIKWNGKYYGLAWDGSATYRRTLVSMDIDPVAGTVSNETVILYHDLDGFLFLHEFNSKLCFVRQTYNSTTYHLIAFDGTKFTTEATFDSRDEPNWNTSLWPLMSPLAEADGVRYGVMSDGYVDFYEQQFPAGRGAYRVTPTGTTTRFLADEDIVNVFFVGDDVVLSTDRGGAYTGPYDATDDSDFTYSTLQV